MCTAIQVSTKQCSDLWCHRIHSCKMSMRDTNKKQKLFNVPQINE